MSLIRHGAAVLAKREDLYNTLLARHGRSHQDWDREIFDIAWEAKNNYAAIEDLYLSLVKVVDKALAA